MDDGMNIVVGYQHCQAGFLFCDYIDQESVADWMATASIVLMTCRYIVIDDLRVPADDCTPIATYDAKLDRMFNRYCGYGRAIEWRPS